MNNIKLLVFDIDGTLVDRSKQTVEESAVAAINQAKANGYEVLIATGRSFFFIHDDVIDKINSQYYVTVNGACLNDNKGNVIHSYPFDNEALKTIIKYCNDREYNLAIKYNDHMGVYGDYETFVDNYVGLDHPGVNHLVDDPNHESSEKSDPLGIFYFAAPQTVDEVKEMLPTLNFIPADNHTIEAIRSDVDKVKNIEDVLSTLNLTWDNVITFGDGNNDVEMLKHAKIGVAMGNANDFVKSNADYVTSNILDDGIKNALEHLKII